jgi:hypothetical protein
LREKANSSCSELLGGRLPIEADLWVGFNDAHAVRADEAHTCCATDLDQFLLEPGSCLEHRYPRRDRGLGELPENNRAQPLALVCIRHHDCWFGFSRQGVRQSRVR